MIATIRGRIDAVKRRDQRTRRRATGRAMGCVASNSVI
jgi:hypothetical protein